MSIRLIIIGVILAAVVASVGGFFLYQKSIVSDLESTIAEKDKQIFSLTEQIAGLQQDKLRLEVSNQTLTSELDRKADETKEAFEEIAVLREKDAESRTRLNEVETILRDQQRLKRIETIRLSRKASLLLRLMDKQTRCYAENFDRVGEGKCVRGKFVPNGDRLVPTATPVIETPEATEPTEPIVAPIETGEAVE